MKLLDWIDIDKMVRNKTFMVVFCAMNAGFVIGAIIQGDFISWSLLNLLSLFAGVFAYCHIHHKEYYKELHSRLKDVWKLLRNKDHIIVLSTSNKDLKNFIDKKGATHISISTHNLVTYPTFLILKFAADILTEDEMILYRAEFQFKRDEYNNQLARESLNKEEKQ